MTNEEFYAERRQLQAAARQAWKSGNGELRSTRNLTATIRMNQICQEASRKPTPADIELCQDYTIVPRTGGAR